MGKALRCFSLLCDTGIENTSIQYILENGADSFLDILFTCNPSSASFKVKVILLKHEAVFEK